MDAIEELRAAVDVSDTNAENFHAMFDLNIRGLTEPVRDALLESCESCTEEEIIGQLLMNILGDEGGGDHLTARLKVRLVTIAEHMGPDWAQALYHAAVFITKVA